jgi:hypothetical protein
VAGKISMTATTRLSLPFNEPRQLSSNSTLESAGSFRAGSQK